MQHGFQRAPLAPDGFAVDTVQVVADRCKAVIGACLQMAFFADVASFASASVRTFWPDPAGAPNGSRP